MVLYLACSCLDCYIHPPPSSPYFPGFRCVSISPHTSPELYGRMDTAVLWPMVAGEAVLDGVSSPPPVPSSPISLLVTSFSASLMSSSPTVGLVSIGVAARDDHALFFFHLHFLQLDETRKGVPANDNENENTREARPERPTG